MNYSSKTVGVVLAGCGVFDGSEIYEATLTLLTLDNAGVKVICMAPDIEQAHVINHVTGDVLEADRRNVMLEAARVARGDIKNMSNVSAGDLDALIFPGGFGAAKNLSSFAFDGSNCSVNSEVSRLIHEMHDSRKPQAFICIAPTICAKVLGKATPILTIGNDQGTANAIETMGGQHRECTVDDIVVDENNKIVSTPAYMLGPSIAFVAKGIEKCVLKTLELIA